MPQDLAVGVKMVSRFDDRFYAIELLNGDVRYIPSVTTLLSVISKDWLPRLRGDIGNREADIRLAEAAERGSRIHHACYIYATGGVVMFEYPPEENHPEAQELKTRNELVIAQCNSKGVRHYKLYRQMEMEQFGRFVKWVEAVKPRFLAAEQVFWSLKYNMAGTLDYVLEIKGGEYAVNGSKPLYIPDGIYIMDVKSGREFDDTYYLQMAAYMKLFEDRRGEPVNGTIGLHVNASTKNGIPGVATYLSIPPETDDHFKRMQEAHSLWTYRNPNVSPRIGQFVSIAAREFLEEQLVYGGIEKPTAEEVAQAVTPAPAAEPAPAEQQLQLTEPEPGEKHGRKRSKPAKPSTPDSTM